MLFRDTRERRGWPSPGSAMDGALACPGIASLTCTTLFHGKSNIYYDDSLWHLEKV